MMEKIVDWYLTRRRKAGGNKSFYQAILRVYLVDPWLTAEKLSTRQGGALCTDLFALGAQEQAVGKALDFSALA